MTVDPGRQCGDEDRHRYRAPLNPVREARERRGLVDRLRFRDHEERLGQRGRVGKLRERLVAARVQESRSDKECQQEGPMKTKVAGAQIVVDSGSRPVCCSRKWPGVFIRSRALAESPNCQIA